MFDIKKYIDKINKELINNNFTFTELLIANKLVSYCTNNEIVISNNILMKMVSDIYNLIMLDDEIDVYDSIIDDYFKREFNK